MEPTDRRREQLPERYTRVVPQPAIETISVPSEATPKAPAARPSRFWPLIGRTFRRHGLKILLLTGIGLAATWFALPRFIPPIFEARTEIQVESSDQTNPMKGEQVSRDYLTYKETQSRRVINPKVIASTLERQPEIAAPFASSIADEPVEAAIHDRLESSLLPGTDLIRVSMKSSRPDGLSEAVDAIVKTFLASANQFHEQGVAERSDKIKDLLKGKFDQVQEKRKSVASLVNKVGSIDAAQGKEQFSAAIAHHGEVSNQLLKVDLEIVEEQAKVEQLRAKLGREKANPRPKAASEADAAAAFYALPEIVDLKAKADRSKQDQIVVERDKPADVAARATARRKVDDAQKAIDDAWARLGPGLKLANPGRTDEEVIAGQIGSSEVKISGLKAKQATLANRLQEIAGANREGGADILALEYARQDLARAEAVLDAINQTSNQDELAAGQPVARLDQVYRARTFEHKQSALKTVVLIGLPGLLFLVSTGFFTLAESRMARLLDPADLPIRTRLNVIGLVPPLPRSMRSLSAGSAGAVKGQPREDFHRFVQSLDYLRVAVCTSGDDQGQTRRNVLITSANENEGKSTLAAQLAERSVNAGLLTLLIDADLRNPSLSRMFDRAGSLGLSSVIRGELMVEEAICTIGDAGGFHFLPAGAIHNDLNRILQSEQLGKLLESARESYDLILIDSPPVLPVADALLIGQWVDGAIIATRHRHSRLPQIEQAARKLESVGISIMGAVVSGVKDRGMVYYGPPGGTDGG